MQNARAVFSSRVLGESLRIFWLAIMCRLESGITYMCVHDDGLTSRSRTKNADARTGADRNMTREYRMKTTVLRLPILRHKARLSETNVMMRMRRSDVFCQRDASRRAGLDVVAERRVKRNERLLLCSDVENVTKRTSRCVTLHGMRG